MMAENKNLEETVEETGLKRLVSGHMLKLLSHGGEGVTTQLENNSWQ